LLLELDGGFVSSVFYLILVTPERVLVSQHRPVADGFNFNSKIPWYPKLLFQRENALASFGVQRVLVTQPRPSQLFALRHAIIHSEKVC
jgi:hypothetical protein